MHTDHVLDRPPGRTHNEKTPPRLWLPAVIKAFRAFNNDHIPNVAASVTFYALLAIFPAISAVISLYGLFGDVSGPTKAIAGLNGLVPDGAVSVIVDDMTRLAAAPGNSLGLAFAISVLISLYSANAGMKALLTGLTTAYEEKERRSFIALYLVSSAFTLAAVVLSVVLLAAVVSTPAVFDALGVQDLAALAILRWPVFLLAVFAAFSVLYRYGPDRSRREHWITPGNVVAALAWMAMSFGFSWYVGHFGNYNKTFGSLGAVAGFMTWIWLSVMVVLFGAELNAAFGRLSLAPS